VDALVWAVSAAAFLTAALSVIAGLSGGTILIGVLYAVGLLNRLVVSETCNELEKVASRLASRSASLDGPLTRR
jgi:hypothetical protein